LALFVRWSVLLYVLIVGAQSLVAFRINAPDWAGRGRYAGIAGTDGQAYYAFIRSIWIDGDLDFENEFYEYNYNRHGFFYPDSSPDLQFLPRSPHTGLYFNRFPVGFSLLHLPFFLLAHYLTLLGGLLGAWNWKADGYTPLYQLAVPIGAIFYAALAYLTHQRVLKRFFDAPVAAWATLTLFLCYPGSFNVIWFWANPHVQTFLVFNLMLLLAFRLTDGKENGWTWIGLGALTGLAALLRTELMVLGFFPFLLFLWQVSRLWRMGNLLAAPGLFARASSAVPACCIVFLPQVIVWKLMWGKWFGLAMNNPSEGFNWLDPAWWQVLFSTRHGLFYWSPVMLIGLVGYLIFLFRKRSGAVLCVALAQLIALYYVYASWKIWWMGYSFGARQFIVVSVLFGIGLGWLIDRFRRHPIWIGVASMVLIVWNQIMLWLFLNGHIPRSEGFARWLPFQKAWELAGRFFG